MAEAIQLWDEAVLSSLMQIHHPALTPVMIAITYLGYFVWIPIAAAMLFFRRTRRLGILLAIALITAAVLANFVIKPIVARPRPYTVLPELPMLISPPGGFSFPSGHTISAFAAATVLWFWKWKAALPATVLAGLIGFSRLYLSCHFVTDVAAGVILGVSIALLVILVYQLWLGKKYPLRPGRQAPTSRQRS